MTPRTRLPSFLAAASALATALLVSASCGDAAETPRPCTNVPEGGCPLARGVACEDPACEAVYACLPGNVWELRARCPAHDAMPRTSRDAEPGDAEAGADARDVDASIEAPPGAFGGPGCASLVAPDCALGVALGCGAGCCGCEDLFVCRAGGWDLWGACGASGPVPTP
jgi:hypothetical protein